MKIIRFTELLIFTVIAGLSLLVTAATYAQAPAGPLTGVPTQTWARDGSKASSTAAASANYHSGRVEVQPG
jgi:hypothetical protein